MIRKSTVLLLLCLCAACASKMNFVPFHERNGIVSDYERMQRGKYIDWISVGSDFRKTAFPLYIVDIVYLGEGTAEIYDSTYKKVDTRQLFGQYLANYLKHYGLFSDIRFGYPEAEDSKGFILKGAIIQLQTKRGYAQYVTGEEMSKTGMGVEMEITRIGDGTIEILAKEHEITTYKNTKGIKEAFDSVARDIAKEIVRILE